MLKIVGVYLNYNNKREEVNVKAIYTVALVLIVIGGLNWGLVGLFDYNLVDMLLGKGSVLARIVYVLVGLSAVYVAVMATMPAKMAETKGA